MISTPMPASTLLPFTAWEQAVFVAIFVIFVLALLYWFTNQQSKWQGFMKELNKTWQDYLSDQRKEDQARIDRVSLETQNGFKNLADSMARLADTLLDHDQRLSNHVVEESALLGAMLTQREKKNVERERTRPRGEAPQ